MGRVRVSLPEGMAGSKGKHVVRCGERRIVLDIATHLLEGVTLVLVDEWARSRQEPALAGAPISPFEGLIASALHKTLALLGSEGHRSTIHGHSKYRHCPNLLFEVQPENTGLDGGKYNSYAEAWVPSLRRGLYDLVLGENPYMVGYFVVWPCPAT